MLQYVFTRPIPIGELDGELRAFARFAAKDGFDTIGAMIVVLQPIQGGQPFVLEQRGSDIPITKVIYESRLYQPQGRNSDGASLGRRGLPR